MTRFALDMWKNTSQHLVGNENVDVWADHTSGGSLTTRYLRGDIVDQLFARQDAGTQYWYLTDHLGSIRDVINNSAVVKDSIGYNAFGEIISETDANFRGRYAWTGREFDTETTLQYNRARYYEAKTGRWISQDPLGFDAGDSNLYRYVKNQIGLDPSGLRDVTPDTYITMAIAGADPINGNISFEVVSASTAKPSNPPIKQAARIGYFGANASKVRWIQFVSSVHYSAHRFVGSVLSGKWSPIPYKEIILEGGQGTMHPTTPSDALKWFVDTRRDAEGNLLSPIYSDVGQHTINNSRSLIEDAPTQTYHSARAIYDALRIYCGKVTAFQRFKAIAIINSKAFAEVRWRSTSVYFDGAGPTLQYAGEGNSTNFSVAFYQDILSAAYANQK